VEQKILLNGNVQFAIKKRSNMSPIIYLVNYT
jgi:hypothetical protein